MRRRLLVLLAIIAAPTFLFAPAFSPQRALLPADLLVQFEPWRSHLSEAKLPEVHWDALVWDGIAQFYPWRRFAAESLRGGVIPLWNPYQFCGTPFLANGQSAVLYPLNLLFWLLPVYYAFAWSAWLHLSLTGWFTYRLLRRIGLAPIPALCGCVVWQLNSFTIAWIHLPTVLCTTAWLPAILLMSERALVSGRGDRRAWVCPPYSLAAGLALGLSCLGGHPQMFMYVGLMTAAYVVARGLSRAVATSIVGRLTRLVRVGAVAGAVGLGLAAAQLLPTLDFLRIAHRAVTIGPESYQAYLGRAFQPVQLAGLLLPHPFGHPGFGTYIGPENYADYCLYVGLVALGLAVTAVLVCRTWHARFFGLAALASLLVALGTALNWPLYHWVPGMASAGGPSRFAVLFIFALALLVAMGADRVSKVRLPRLLPVVQVVLLVILATDLLLAARGHLHIVPRDWAYAEAASPGPVEGRIIGNAADWPLRQFPSAVLPPNAATVYHLRDVGGYDSLYLARYRDFASLIQGGDPSPPANGNMILFRLSPAWRAEMARLAGVRTYLAPTQEKRMAVLQDEVAMPRAWVTPSAISLPTHPDVCDALPKLGATVEQVVITGAEEPTEGGETAGVTQLRDPTPNAVEVTLSGGGGYLFLADSYAPGWHAYADGKPLRVMPADVTFRAVAVPQHATKVVFRYEPASFRVGLFVSLLAVALVTGCGIALWTRRQPEA